jgi:hypothetical protein
MFNWHFTNQILLANNTQSNLPFLKKKVPPSVEQSRINPYNVTYIIESAIATLQTPDSLPNSGETDKTLMKSLMLRNLIHFVGDIHQPLHATTRIAPLTPDGDQGGNLYNITWTGHPEVQELHFVWDHAFYQFPIELNSPLDPETRHLPAEYAEKYYFFLGFN